MENPLWRRCYVHCTQEGNSVALRVLTRFQVYIYIYEIIANI